MTWTQPSLKYAAANGSDFYDASVHSNTTLTFEVTCVSDGSPTLSRMFLNLEAFQRLQNV